MGGSVVATSLAAVGLEEPGRGVCLVETEGSGSPIASLLVQNAWNVVSPATFRELSRRYPRRWRLRARARRAVAQRNIRRAERVVVLSDYMARLVREQCGVEPLVAPVSAALPLLEPRDSSAEPLPRHDVVCLGTVTWYKQPHLALDVHDAVAGREGVLYLGRDDGSGCWQELQARAVRRGIRVERAIVPRPRLGAVLGSGAPVVLPSALESFGFGLSDALTITSNVFATRNEAHAEVATRLGVEPGWLETGRPPAAASRARVREKTLRAEWERVAGELTRR